MSRLNGVHTSQPYSSVGSIMAVHIDLVDRRIPGALGEFAE